MGIFDPIDDSKGGPYFMTANGLGADDKNQIQDTHTCSTCV